MQEKVAVELVKDPSTPGYYSRMFVVLKPGGKWRPLSTFVPLPSHLSPILPLGDISLPEEQLPARRLRG